MTYKYQSSDTTAVSKTRSVRAGPNRYRCDDQFLPDVSWRVKSASNFSRARMVIRELILQSSCIKFELAASLAFPHFFHFPFHLSFPRCLSSRPFARRINNIRGKGKLMKLRQPYKTFENYFEFADCCRVCIKFTLDKHAACMGGWHRANNARHHSKIVRPAPASR